MRTDRELLELAARAAGLELRGLDGPYGWLCSVEGKNWNPFTNDGQALRLAVALDILVSPIANSGDDAYARVRAVDRDICLGEPHGADKYAAVRRAIVRAAAEIGAAM